MICISEHVFSIGVREHSEHYGNIPGKAHFLFCISGHLPIVYTGWLPCMCQIEKYAESILYIVGVTMHVVHPWHASGQLQTSRCKQCSS